MIRNLLSTSATRLIIAILNLCIVWLIARFMGAAILGTVSLIILGISIIQLFTAVLAGSSLVYQASRKPISELLIIAWIWIPVSSIPVWLILYAFNLLPEGFNLVVLLLAMVGSLITINQNLFLGKEKISLFNWISVIQSLLMFCSLVFIVFVMNLKNEKAYVIAQFISYILCAAIGTIINFPPLNQFKAPERQTVIDAFKFGGYLQSASIMQLFNYRLSYYLIEKYFDRATLGVFSLGVQIAESVWILAKSMAILLYSKLSNNDELSYSYALTLNFIKIITVATILMISIITLLPPAFFAFIFQKEFTDITTVVAGLAPGIVAVAVSLMLSHYFSGTGKPYHNTISSGLGLVFTIILGYTLIPVFGLMGAAITSSVSYICSVLYQLIVFKRFTGIKWITFIPRRSDLNRAIRELKQ